MATEAEELVGFLRDSNAQVAMQALDLVVGLTASEDGLTTLAPTKVIAGLQGVVTRTEASDEEIAKGLTALVNMSGSDLFARNFAALSKRLCGSLVNIIQETGEEASNAPSKFEKNKKFTIVELCCMLLANISRSEAGVDAVLQRGEGCEEGRYFCGLLDCFVRYTRPGVKTRTVENSENPYSHIASVLMNVTQSDVAQRLLLDPNRGILRQLLSRLSHSDVTVRKGVSGALKNCMYSYPESDLGVLCFGEEKEGGLNLLPPLLLPLVRTDEKLSNSDIEGMPEEWVEKNRNGKFSSLEVEKDEDVKKCLVECILLLARSKPVREKMREIQVYPIIRDLDKIEEKEEIKDLIYKIVEFLMRDEENTPSSSSSSSSSAPETGIVEVDE